MIPLALFVSDPARSDLLTNAFLDDPRLTVTGIVNAYEQMVHRDFRKPEAEVIVVDLALPDATLPRFWAGVNLLYCTARLLGLAEPEVEAARVWAAAHAGVHWFASWTDTPEQWCEAAVAAYRASLWVAPGPVYEALFALFDERAARVPSAPGASGADGRRADWGGVALTPLESKVLAYLTWNAGRVVTPDELLREVWGCDLLPSGSKAAVKKVIKRLRRKIEREPGQPRRVQTVRGRGYVCPQIVPKH